MPGPLDRDLDQTAQQLAKWLPQALGDARDVRVEMDGGPASTGFSSDTLMFDAVWRDAAGAERREALVARLEPSGVTVFPHYDVARQFQVMERLAATDVPVPRVRWLVPDPAILGAPFYVMDRIEGRVPTDNPPYNQGGWVHELPVADRTALWFNGLDTLARIHRLDWEGLGFGFLDQPERGEEPLDQLLAEYDVFRSWGLDPERHVWVDRARRWLVANKPVGEPTALCWGDSRLGNQIFRELECVAVLDWEMVHLGSPVHDLGWWIAIDRCFADGIGLERLEGLPDRAATVARWEERTGRRAENLDYYEVLSLFQFTAIMARIGMRMKHYGILPADHEMDRANLASLTLERKLGEVGE